MDTLGLAALPWSTEIDGWVKDHLQQGALLISTAHFLRVCEVEYHRRTGASASQALKAQFREKIEAFTAAKRQGYVTQGVKNGIVKGFRAGVTRLGWQVPQIKGRGPNTINRFLDRKRIKTLFNAAGISQRQIDPADCINTVLDHITPERGTEAQQSSVITLSAQAAEAWRHGRSDCEFLNARLLQQKRQQTTLAQLGFGALGLENRQEAPKKQSISARDQKRVERKQVQGRRLYRATLDPAGGETDSTRTPSEGDETLASYLQVLLALRQISAKYDDALRFLVCQKDAVIAAADSPELSRGLDRLVADPRLGMQLFGMMVDDLELRMLYWRLPPYHLPIIPPRQDCPTLTINKDFVDRLRQFDPAALKQDLEKNKGTLGQSIIADIKGFIALLDHLLYPCPWRLGLQVLRIKLGLKEIFRSGEGIQEARKQAQALFSFGLSRLLPDLAPKERRALQERRVTLINAAEQNALNPNPALKANSKGADAALRLSAEEIEQGVQLGYVETRVAGTYQKGLYPLLPDLENGGQYILAQRPPSGGPLIPILQRGVKCRVRQRQNGFWRRAR